MGALDRGYLFPSVKSVSNLMSKSAQFCRAKDIFVFVISMYAVLHGVIWNGLMYMSHF